METRPTRAAVYCRISRDAAGTGDGVDRQRDACLKLAADRGWLVSPDHVIVENDTSATKGKRPGYARLLALAESGTVDVIIGWAMDRITRKVTELEALIELSERTGVKIATVSGDLDLTTDAGRLVGRILASVARGEVERKGARQKAANLQRAERGDPPVARCYGYNRDGSVHPVEADHVRQVFARFAAGASLSGLVRWLNEHGQRPARGDLDEFGISGLRYMLRNRRYVGERWSAGEYVGPGTWSALVEPDLFAAVQTMLSDPTRKTHTGTARKWLGAGLYRCGVCDDGTTTHTYQKTWRSRVDGSVRRQRMYRCEKIHLVRKADPIDEFVHGVILARLRRPDIADLVADDRDASAVRTLRDEAIGLRTRMDAVADDYAAGTLTARQVKIATDRMTARLTEVEAQLSELGNRTALGQIAAAADPGAAWLALDVIQRAVVVDTLAEVTILKGKPGRAPFDPDTVRIEWRTA